MKRSLEVRIIKVLVITLMLAGIGGASIVSANEVYDTVYEVADNLIPWGASGDVLNPSATYYNGKTYIVVDTDSDAENKENAWVLYFNHSNNTVSNQYFTMRNDWTMPNSHGIPTICRDNSGYLHVFSGGGWGDRYAYYTRSTNTDDITSWNARQQVLSSGHDEFPHPIVRTNGEIWVWYMCYDYIKYIKSSDNGDNWTGTDGNSYVMHIGDISNGDYIWIGKIHYSPSPERVHFTWVKVTNETYTGQVFYSYYNFSNSHMYSASGVDLGSYIDSNEADTYCRVYNNPTSKIRAANVHADSNGVPYIIFNENGNYQFTRWNGSAWTAAGTVTSTAGGYFTQDNDFIVHSSTNIEAYFQLFSSTPDTSRLEKWTWDGTGWTKLNDLLVGEQPVAPCVVQNWDSKLKVMASQIGDTGGRKGWGIGDSTATPAPTPTPTPISYPQTVNDSTTGNNTFQYFFKGTWRSYAPYSAYLGDEKYCNTTNDYYQVSFIGSQAKIYSSKVYDAGIAAISVDGGPETDVDCYSTGQQYQVLLYTTPIMTYGQHHVKVRVKGTKNASSSGYYIYADKVEITAPDRESTITNDNTTGTDFNQVNYTGTWSYGTGNQYLYSGDQHYSHATDSSLKVIFDGTQIKMYSSKVHDAGIAAISIDDGPETDVDLYSATAQYQQLIYTSPSLSPGRHTLKVRVKGTKNVNADGYYVYADKFETEYQ